MDSGMKSILHRAPFALAQEYAAGKGEGLIQKKYAGVQHLPDEKLHTMMMMLKQPEFFPEFRRLNLALTTRDIRNAVTPDVLIGQASANLSELDKAGNLLVKRLREWYGWYAPEVVERITDHHQLVELIHSKNRTELLKELREEETMGANLEKADVDEILLLAKQVKELFQLREQHEKYLKTMMQKHCPNLLELAGTTIGAKLIELGKGLKRLALLPASTIQLLGAEKALFRHIKTGARSPKYGILINHPFVQQAKKDKKGKAARMLADKLSLCARLDYFKGEFKAKEYRKELEKRLEKWLK